MKTPYCEIVEKYPNTITLDQFYRICHISKRKAKWLLDNGYLVCRVSGNAKRHYKIQTTDLVEFLIRTDGLTKNIDYRGKRFSSVKVSRRQHVHYDCVDPQLLEQHLLELWVNEEDILPYSRVRQLVGYTMRTVGRWVAHGKVKAIRILSKPLILKESLAQFIAFHTIRYPANLSTVHIELVEQYLSKAHYNQNNI